MGADRTPYWRGAWGDEGCSACACFRAPEVSHAPFALIAGQTSMTACVRLTSGLGPEALEGPRDMVAFDAPVCNTGRHLADFGYPVDARTRRVVRPAPLFGNGRALFPNYGGDKVRGAAMLARLCRPAFGPPDGPCPLGPCPCSWPWPRWARSMST